MTHDHQAEDTTLLAMALIIPTGYLKEYGETKESGDGITQTYYAMLDAQPDQPVPCSIILDIQVSASAECISALLALSQLTLWLF